MNEEKRRERNMWEEGAKGSKRGMRGDRKGIQYEEKERRDVRGRGGDR